MACIEGNNLKSEVLNRADEYVAAEQAQHLASGFDEEFSQARLERAHALLSEARRRYFLHLKAHQCENDPAQIVKPGMLNAIAV